MHEFILFIEFLPVILVGGTGVLLRCARRPDADERRALSMGGSGSRSANEGESSPPPTPSGQKPRAPFPEGDSIPDMKLPPTADTTPKGTPTKALKRQGSTFNTPTAAIIDETWGTRQRMEALLTRVDQAGIEEMIDRAMKRNNPPKFMAKFYPHWSWLWRQWQGTVLQRTWPSAMVMMVVTVLLVIAMETARKEGLHTWSLLEVPNPQDEWVARMLGFTTMWGYLLTMATFVNSFFLSQAYGYWLAQKGNVRKVQGRLSDMGMLLAIHARRDAETGKFTAESLELLETIARWMRLYHMLFWASQVRPARGDNAVSYSLLRTEVGLRGLLERGALTEREFSLLMDDTAVSETKRHSAVLEWIMARFIDARYTGMLQGNAGLDARFLEEGCKLRAVCGNIADDAAAPMPLSYVHLVQLLVDTLVVLAPFALYPKLGVLTIALSPVLVFFYRGFLELSKSFLDPFGNGDSLAENFSVSCLLCEVNAASVRWFSSIRELPFATHPDAKGKPDGM